VGALDIVQSSTVLVSMVDFVKAIVYGLGLTGVLLEGSSISGVSDKSKLCLIRKRRNS
jgi:hypothetical protein